MINKVLILILMVWCGACSVNAEKNISAVSIPMHFGLCHGVWQMIGELNSNKGTINIASTRGTDTLFVDAASGKTGQLICFIDSSGNHVSNIIDSVMTGKLALRFTLERGVPVGSIVYAWWSNYAHPTNAGYRSIADYMVSYLDSNALKMSTCVINSHNFTADSFTVIGNPAISVSTTVDRLHPCSDSIASYNAICAQNEGVYKNFAIPADNYIIEITANFGTKGTQNKINLISGSDTVYTDTLVSRGNGIVVKKIKFTSTSSSTTLRLTQFSNASHLYIGKIRIVKLESTPINLNSTCITYGDSWLADTSTSKRLKVHYYAPSINKGVGGNTSTQALSRFTTDIPKHMPDYSLVILGTNDLYQSVGLGNYKSNISKITDSLQSHNIKPIYLDCSVGTNFYSGWDTLQLTKVSRNYALSTEYSKRKIFNNSFRIGNSKKYIKITINNAHVKTADKYVPIPISNYNMPDSFFSGLAYADGRDIVCSDSIGNLLRCKKINLDKETRKLYMWVRVDTLKTTGTNNFYLQCGDSSINIGRDTSDRTTYQACHTVNTDYRTVYHLYDSYNSSGLIALNGTNNGTTIDSSAGSKFGKSVKFGNSQYISVADNMYPPCVIRAWIKRDGAGNWTAYDGLLGPSGGTSWSLAVVKSNNKFTSYYGNSRIPYSATSTAYADTSKWFNVVSYHNGIQDSMRFMTDTTDISETRTVSSSSYTAYDYIGRWQSYYFDGKMSNIMIVNNKIPTMQQLKTMATIEKGFETNAAFTISNVSNFKKTTGNNKPRISLDIGL